MKFAVIYIEIKRVSVSIDFQVNLSILSFPDPLRFDFSILISGINLQAKLNHVWAINPKSLRVKLLTFKKKKYSWTYSFVSSKKGKTYISFCVTLLKWQKYHMQIKTRRERERGSRCKYFALIWLEGHINKFGWKVLLL